MNTITHTVILFFIKYILSRLKYWIGETDADQYLKSSMPTASELFEKLNEKFPELHFEVYDAEIGEYVEPAFSYIKPAKYKERILTIIYNDRIIIRSTYLHQNYAIAYNERHAYKIIRLISQLVKSV